MRDENNTFEVLPFENGLFYISTEPTNLVVFNNVTNKMQFISDEIKAEIEEELKPFIDKLIDLYK